LNSKKFITKKAGVSSVFINTPNTNETPVTTEHLVDLVGALKLICGDVMKLHCPGFHAARS
jgi:hypothetical protein